ncbi:MAG: hypothetical protein R2744_07590 [Bacteroidales bacterium]
MKRSLDLTITEDCHYTVTVSDLYGSQNIVALDGTNSQIRQCRQPIQQIVLNYTLVSVTDGATYARQP